MQICGEKYAFLESKLSDEFYIYAWLYYLSIKTNKYINTYGYVRTVLNERVLSDIAMETLPINTLSYADMSILQLCYLKIKSK